MTVHSFFACYRRARHHGVDGVVVLAVDDAEQPELQKLIAAGTPVVAVDLALVTEVLPDRERDGRWRYCLARQPSLRSPRGQRFR